MPGSECARDPKVSETRLAVPSDQDVALYTLGVNARVYIFPHFTYRSDVAVQYSQPMKKHEALACLSKLSRRNSQRVILVTSILESMNTHQQ